MSCHGHTNSCPSHPGYDPPLSPVSWQDDPLDTNDEVEAYYHFYYLAWYIDYELNRRGDTPFTGWFDPISDASFDTDDIIYGSDYWLLSRGINDAANGWTPTYATEASFQPGEDITFNAFTEMRDKLNDLRQECLCNCNYSCTCNCNYCTCNCNYACTCNCNYSDRRLKTDIKYL